MNSNVNWDRLNSAAYTKFDCQWLSAAQRYNGKVSDRQHRKRMEKQRAVFRTLGQLRDLMESDQPPKTKEEAVMMLSPVLAWLLMALFRTLIIRVIEWAWDEIHSNEGHP